MHHIEEVKKKLTPKMLLGNKVTASMSALGALEGDCYVCGRINRNLTAMISTAVYLFETDEDFRAKFAKAPYFCLPHYRAMVEYASKKMGKRSFPDFYEAAHGIQTKYLDSLGNDVSWFCKKFDYRYDEEPWYNSKDSVQRTIKFLCGSPEET